jgi:hypothetical protein
LLPLFFGDFVEMIDGSRRSLKFFEGFTISEREAALEID